MAAMMTGKSLRFTPTGVGKTEGDAKRNQSSEVHPHGCGEDLPFELASVKL